jgi:hypothetical protein
MIRDAKIADFPAILGLNLEMEQYLSPLSEELLSDLYAVAVYHRVIETKQGEGAGFLLALSEEPATLVRTTYGLRNVTGNSYMWTALWLLRRSRGSGWDSYSMMTCSPLLAIDTSR